MLALLLSLVLQAAPPAPSVATEETPAPTVSVPRLEATIAVDGRLEEQAWSQAARLDGFWQEQPVDGRPAEERSVVLVWYSPEALHLGILAYDRDPSAIRATVADRDNLDRDDTVSIFLDTFLDRRRAFVFTVNPLGAQEDGVHSEGVQSAARLGATTFDKNPDYRFDSQGRITGEGYVVEVRIPFKSLRYPGGGPQRWGFNVRRKVQRTGYEDTWTRVRRANASFLTQAGILEGLHDLKRGVVKEVQPFVTGANNGVRRDDGFARGSVDLSTGLNARLGFTNLSIDATVNPDFSQVESDAGLVTVNERFALFFPEKRPFFLEGIELLATPNQLVYTRQIVDPLVGGKVTGKVGRLSVAHLTAVDEARDGRVTFNVTRLRRDIGLNSLAGLTYTDRTGSSGSNRVVAGDVRWVFGRVYFVQGQAGHSWTEAAGSGRGSPIWNAIFDRTGRAWGFNYTLTGIGEEFETRSGFVPRTGIVELRTSNRLSLYGARGALVESFTIRGGPKRLWRFNEFGREAPVEGEDQATLQTQLRGGWAINGAVRREYFRFEAESYEAYEVVAEGALVQYQAPERMDNAISTSLTVTTPNFQRFGGKVELTYGGTPIFQEASEGRETRVVATAVLRPSGLIRIEAATTWSSMMRARDESEFARTIIPRLKVEYQPRRSLFFRVIGEYRVERQAPLADARTGARLLVGGVERAARDLTGLRLDWLAAYEPTPGTAAYFGYGALLDAPLGRDLGDLRRSNDGFFLKLAYQFRW